MVVAEAVAQLEAERVAGLLELDAGFQKLVPGVGKLVETDFLNQSVRQFISWPTLPNGIAFHLPLTTTDSLESYQPPFFLPIVSAMSLTSTNLSSNRNGQLKKIRVMSGPLPVSAAVATRVCRLPTLINW